MKIKDGFVLREAAVRTGETSHRRTGAAPEGAHADEQPGSRAVFSRIEDVLAEEHVFAGTASGVSMYPMIRNRRDAIIIRPVQGRLKKYDIPVYRRGDKYILHRVIEVRPEGYVILGDNCIAKEHVSEDRIVGVMTEFYRGDKKVDLNSLPYRLYCRVWLALYPLRRLYKRLRGRAGRIKRALLAG